MQSQSDNTQYKLKKEESNPVSSYGDQSETTQYSEDPAQIEAILVPHLEKMFQLENVKAQSYLMYRLNANMEMKSSAIFKERSVLEITQDYQIIESALKKCSNIEYYPDIRMIRLKSTSERKTVLVKGIAATKEADFVKFVTDLCGGDEKTKQFDLTYDKKTECASITFSDESSTLAIFSKLISSKFQDTPIDCIIKDSNPYIELLDGAKKPRGGYYPYQSSYYQNPMYGYPPQYPSMYYMMPQSNYPMSNYPPYGQKNWNGGYQYPRSDYHSRGGKQYYYTRKYEKGTEEDQENQTDQGGYKGERKEYRGERREYRGDRRGRGGYGKRGNYQETKQSKEEIEKLTTVDPTNYPPLS